MQIIFMRILCIITQFKCILCYVVCDIFYIITTAVNLAPQVHLTEKKVWIETLYAIIYNIRVALLYLTHYILIGHDIIKRR